MPPQLAELETLMQQLIAAHEKLLASLDKQQAAMKNLNLAQMEDEAAEQENLRVRIAAVDLRRRTIVVQMAKALRLNGEPTLARIAENLPHERLRLLNLRDRLKELTSEVASRAHIVGRVAGAVLGHLNTVVRLLAGAVEQAGLYTKHGIPQVSARIGVMEAVA